MHSWSARKINCTTLCNLCNTMQNKKIIPCNTITNNKMQYNAMQYHAMQYHAITFNAIEDKTISCNTHAPYNEIPCNALFRSFETSTGPNRVYFGPLQCIGYVFDRFLKVDRSIWVSFCRTGKCPFLVLFF